MSKDCFYYHIKKCAGSSVKQLLGSSYQQVNQKDNLPFVAYGEEYWNDVLNDYRLCLGRYDYKRVLFASKFLYSREKFDDMFKFTVVRNPYDRRVSLWMYYNKYNKYSNSMSKILGGGTLAFESFVRIFFNKGFKNPKYRHFSTHSCPASCDITDENGRVLLDYVARVEDLESMTAELSENLDLAVGSMPKVNNTRDNNDYRQFYNNRSRSLVEEIYREDLKMFGYKF